MELTDQQIARQDFVDNAIQAKLLKEHVMENPYESCIILGIASMVECVFTLSKTSYPVPLQLL